MKRFTYKALAPSGELMSGTIEAENEADLRKQIEARGMMAVEMTPETGLDQARNFNLRAWMTPRAGDKDVTEFLQQLAALLQASIRPDNALDLLGAQGSW